ncbi:JIL-1 [Drosophila busckii]|uniref:JIL-1 n=1 Tax=Drosophila busckii TaxID=30019 RepID=A0A0M5J075_DROBS|nr:JIL-1 [Drosophila busckii]
MSRFQSRNKIESIIIASTNSNARSSRKANNSPPPMEHINGHAATTNGNSRSSKRRRQSDVELTNGTSSKRAMLKETSESSSNRKYNNNNVSNTNGSRQFNNNNNNNNNKKHSVNPATKQTKTTSSMEFSYRNNDISTIPTPPSPASPASPPPTSSAAAARGNQVPEVVCISDGESEEDIDHDTEEDDEPEIDETPTTSNNNRQPNNKSAPPTAGGSASPPSYAMPTSNSVPIDLENEVHRNDLEHVTDLRSYVNLLKEERVSLDDFLIIRVLGTGAYGRVFLVRKLTKHDSGKLYAMKVLNKITVVQKRKTAEHTKTERVVLEAVQRSPFLVGLHYAFQSSSKLYLVLAQYCAKVVPLSKYRASELDALTSCATDSHNPHHIVSYHGAYRDKCEVWIITEYLSGKELSTALQAQEFDESACRNIFLQLLDALKFVHSKHFIHGDVKPENVLFVDQDRSSVRLLDFGSASYNSRFQTWKDHPRYTLDYAPPELLKDRAVVSYSPAVDIYGLGATLYTMLVGHAPYRSFHGDNDHSIEAHHKLRRRITKEAFNQRSKRWCNASPQFRELVEWCLQRDPANRPKFNDLIRCAWLQHGLGFELTITPMPEQEVVDLSDDTMEEEPIAAPAEEQMEVTATSIESPSSPVTAERTEEPKSSDLMKNLFNAADFEDHSDFYGFDERAPPLRLPSEYYMEIPLPLLECEVAEPEPPAQTLPDVAADQTTNDATQRKRTRQQQRTRKVVGTAVEPEDTKAGLYLLMQQVTPPVDVVPPSVDIVPLPLSVFMARRAERATSPLEEMFSGFRKQEATWRKSRASWRQFCSLLNGVQQVLKQRFKRQRIYCAPAINIKSERIDYAYEKPLVFPRPKPRAARQPKPAKIPRAPTRVQPARARALHQKYVFE